MTNQSNQAALFNTNKLLHQDSAPPQVGTAQKVMSCPQPRNVIEI